MRLLTISSVLIAVVGCSASTPVILHNLTDTDKSQAVVINSRCDKECKLAIYEDGRFAGDDGSIFFGTGTSIAKITVQSINGLKGTTTHTSNCGGSGFINVFNGAWDWSLNLELAPGKTNISTYSSNCNIRNRTMHNIEINLEPGHKYTLALVSRKTAGSGYYDNEAIEWYPVMYDYTAKKLVVNHSSSGWLKP